MKDLYLPRSPIRSFICMLSVLWLFGCAGLQNLEYALKGKLQLGGIHAAALPFTSEGTLNLQQLSSSNPGAGGSVQKN